jgi:hypothetical protein
MPASARDRIFWLFVAVGARQGIAQPAASSVFMFPIYSQGCGIGSLRCAHSTCASAPVVRNYCISAPLAGQPTPSLRCAFDAALDT